MVSSPSSSPPMKYHVFLSFRGEDTRLNFTTHLLDSLVAKGLDVFFDDKKLERGGELFPKLLAAIEASRLSIIVLSADYASSKSCLTELSHIMDRRSSHEHIVLPIFYHVKLSDVQNIDDGCFKKSFDDHKSEGLDQEQLLRWKDVVAQIGTLERKTHIKVDRPETEHIENIVEHVIDMLVKHQVFLSPGKDTRLKFNSYLLQALRDKGINVVFNEEREREEKEEREREERKEQREWEEREQLSPVRVEREQLSQALSQAIAASNLSIVILSKDYASSKTCLAELCDIMDRKDTKGHIVLPIFYHVDPFDVRHRRGSFEKSFNHLKGLKKVQEWENAFAKIGSLKGWHIKGCKFDRDETKYIKDIVDDVNIKMKNVIYRRASKELVGIEKQKERISDLIKQKGRCVIGLWGMNGIGKTTLAEAVYNEFFLSFEGRCFVHNVSEKIKKQGMESLRNELLFELINEKDIRLDTPSIGSRFIQERLRNKRVLVVLDDVNHPDQIEDMGVKHFGNGSKIIVTSTDKQVLHNGEVDEVIDVKELDRQDALQLFSTFAFKQLSPTAGFQELSEKFAIYAKGCPLALKVLGSQLYKRSEQYWTVEMNRLDEYPQSEISQILKRSFDELHGIEKNIFLDIALFFKGESKEDVEVILSSRYNKSAVLITTNKLVDKCLLYITSSECISMHDMLEEMGKEIVLQEPKCPSKRTRLWSPEDVVQVLRNNKRIGSIEGIKLDMSQIKIDDLKKLLIDFKNMFNLRYIYFYNSEKKLLAENVDIATLPNGIRYLRCDYYPAKTFLSDFNPTDLVILILHHGSMEQLWNENHKELVNLRKIDLFSCNKLKGIPTLSTAINLKFLGCRSCKSLNELLHLNHSTSLESLEISDCKDLREIPNLSRAVKLKILDCSLCTKLDALPGLNHLVSLEKLNLSGCKDLSEIPNLSGASNLKILDCSLCKSLVALSGLNRLESLEKLDLSDCKNLRVIPSLSGAVNLKILDCRSCKRLVELPDLDHLESLEKLDLSGCKNLSKIPNLSGATKLEILCCNRCKSLVELPCLNHLTSLKTFQFEGCCNLKDFPELDLSNTDIEEVSDSISHLVKLRKLRLRNSKVKIVSSNISGLKYLHTLDLSCCKGLKSFLELPRYLWCLDASDCTSLEKISFTGKNDSCDYTNEENIFMLFSNCFSLNQDSIHNIEANAMFQIRSMAKRWERREQREGSYVQKKLFCCFSGNVISANQFDYQSVDSSLKLEIAPNGCSESRRAFAFAICLVANLRCESRGLAFICKYQLRVTDEDEFKECRLDIHGSQSFTGDHVFILFSEDMIIPDKDYKRASFEFYIKNDNDEKEIEVGVNKVKKCGVQVIYLEKVHADFTPNKRKLSYDGEDDKGFKRLK